MITVVALAAILVVALVTAGVMVATWTAAPLLTAFVTTAVKLPDAVGLVENVTVNVVAVAVVTVPTAPLLNTTLLFAAVVLNPKPLMVIVVESAARFVVLLVTTGTTVATWTAVPLITPLVVTMAVKLPVEVGRVVRFTVNKLAVAELTVPTAPLLNVTVLLLAVASNAKP